jgi:hypothetical protein
MSESQQPSSLSNFLQQRYENYQAAGLLTPVLNTHTGYQYFEYQYTRPSDLITEHTDTFAVKGETIMYSRENKVVTWDADDITTKVIWRVPGPHGVLSIEFADEAAHEDDVSLKVILFPHDHTKSSWGAAYAPLDEPDNHIFQTYSAGNNEHHHVILTPIDQEFEDIQIDDDWIQNRQMNLRAGYIDNKREFEVVFPQRIHGVSNIRKSLEMLPEKSIFERNPTINPWNYFKRRFGVIINLQ